MSDLVFSEPGPGKPGVEMIGPFESAHYRVCLDGFRLPYLEAWPTNAQRTEWTVLLDGRFALDIGEEHLQQFIWFLADAMAIAAGYKSHNNACEHQQDRHNPFGTRMIGLAELPTEPAP